MKVIHIHSDLKFVFESQKFEGKYFENLIIIINNIQKYEGPYKECAHFFKYNPKTVNKIVKLCEGADLVILYDLDTIKTQIAIKLPPTIMIAWRFFGYELYRKDAKQYLSSITIKANQLNHLQNFKEAISKLYSQAITNFFWGNLELQFQQAVRRINIFLGTSLEEYNDLKVKWPELPNYVKLPFSRKYTSEGYIAGNKEKLVILGNNKSVYNNHLDIINIINVSSKQNQYKFVLIYNYGPESNYSSYVRASVKDKQNYCCIEKFMPYKQLFELYQRAGSAVFNGYRQMALGNIFLALGQGVKVYLNNRNIVMQWLQNEGFKVFPINELAFDLENDNTLLHARDAQHNFELLHKFQNSYNVGQFQQVISSLMDEKAFIDQ
jgi:hypothetical protein